MHYQLNGQSIGSCGCRLSIDCLCWNENQAINGCDSFVAYYIEAGSIQSISVATLTLVRWIREADQASIFFIDSRASDKQADLLVQAFTGHLGGILADISSVLPSCQSWQRFPMQYKKLENGFVELWLQGDRVHQTRPKLFEYT